MKREIFKWIAVVGVVTVVWTGCGQKEEPLPVAPPVPPAPPKREAHFKTTPTSETMPPSFEESALAGTTTVADASAGLPTAADLEKQYLANPEFTDRVQTIFQLSNLGSPEAVSVLGRLFQKEPDPDLRLQVLNLLFNIEGQDANKATLLTAGIATNQTKEVREAAVNALGSVDAKFAMPILQVLLNDVDEDVRERAKDTIELLQTQEAMQK